MIDTEAPPRGHVNRVGRQIPIGIFCTFAVQTPLIWALSKTMPLAVALQLAFMTAGQVSFLLKSCYVWDDKHPKFWSKGLWKRWLGYTIVNWASGFVNTGAQLGIRWLLGLLGVPNHIVVLVTVPVANGITMALDYVINHYVVFRKKKPAPQQPSPQLVERNNN